MLNHNKRFLYGKVLIISLIVLPILVVVISFVLSYINRNDKYVLYDDQSFSIHCYSNDESNDWNVIENVNVGDKIVCNVSYELSRDLSRLSYELDYGKSLKISNIDTYWGNINDLDASLNISGNLFSYTYTREISFDDSPNITFEVIGNKESELYISIKDIKFLTSDKEYFYEDDVYYLFDLKDKEIVNKIDYGNSLDVATSIYMMENNKLPTFDILDKMVDEKYHCEERVINENGTVYLNNCDVNGQLLSHRKKYEENANNGIIYIYKYNDSYFVSKEKNNAYALVDLYGCQTDYCSATIRDGFIIIGDLDLKYKKVNYDDDYTVIYPQKYYNIDNIVEGRNLFVRYYEKDDLKIYNYFEYGDEKLINQYVDGEINDSIKTYFTNSDYDVSFSAGTLDNGYILVNNRFENAEKNMYIYDYKNNKVIYDLEVYDDFDNELYFFKRDSRFIVLNDNPLYQSLLYFNSNMKRLYGGVVHKDSNFYELKDDSIIFKNNDGYYLYDKDGNLIKNLFNNIDPDYIEVDDKEKVYGIVYTKGENNFKIYDGDGKLVHTSNVYQQVYDVYKSFNKIYILVNENGYLKQYDKDEKLIALYIEITDNLEFDFNYYGDVWIRDKNIKIGENGAYILFYYDFENDSLNVSQKQDIYAYE